MDYDNKKIIKEASSKLEVLYKKQIKLDKISSKFEKNFNIINRLDSKINNRVQVQNLVNESDYINLINKDFINKLNNLLSKILNNNNLLTCFNENNIQENKITQTEQSNFINNSLEKEIKKLEIKVDELNVKNSNILKENTILKKELEEFNKDYKETLNMLHKKEKELEEIIKELEATNKIVNDLNNENNNLKSKIEHLSCFNNEFNKLKKILDSNTDFNKNSVNSITINQPIYNNRISFGYDNRYTINNQKNNDNKIFDNDNPVLLRFINHNLMKYVFNYLSVTDISNLKLANSVFNNSIEKDTFLSNIYYMKIIKSKNDRIIELKTKSNDFSVNEEYCVNNETVEKLINNYIINKKPTGEKLKSIFVKSLEFVETGVKPKLEKYKNNNHIVFNTNSIRNNNNPTSNYGASKFGISSEPPVGAKTPGSNNNNISSSNYNQSAYNNNNNNNQSGYSSFLGVFGGLLNYGSNNISTSKTAEKPKNELRSGYMSRGIATPKVDSPKSYKTNDKFNDNKSDNMSISTVGYNNNNFSNFFDTSDRNIVNSHNNNSCNYEFNYSPNDLVKIFKEYIKRDMSNSEVTAFFNQLVLWFSELLYSVKVSLDDINDMSQLLEALNTRYKCYQNRNKKLVIELSRVKENKEKVNDLNNQIDNYKRKRNEQDNLINNLVQEINKLNINSSENEKLVKIYKQKWLNSENNSFKTLELYREENSKLKFDLLEQEKDKTKFKSILVDFKKFMNNNKII